MVRPQLVATLVRREPSEKKHDGLILLFNNKNEDNTPILINLGF